MDGKDQIDDRTPTGSRLNAEEKPVVDSKIGQRILGRYATSPGVIPLDSVLQRASYKTQFGISRLPLLIDIQRRWAFTNAPFQHGWPALLYAYPADTADELSPATAVSEPSSRPGLTGQVSPVARTYVPQSAIAGGGQANEPHNAAAPKISADLNNSGNNMVARSLQRKVVTAEPVLPRATAPVDNGAMTHPASFSVEGGLDTVIDARRQKAEPPPISPSTSADLLETTSLQHHLDDSAKKTVESTIATPQQTLPDSRTRGDIREGVTPSISQNNKRPLMQPTVETQYPTSGASTAMPPASSIGEEGRAILQRHLNRSSKGIIQRTMVPLDLTDPARPATPAPVDNGVMTPPPSVSGEGGSQPVVIDAEHQTAESPAVSFAASTDHLGTTILQRSLDDPAIRAVQRPTPPNSRTRGDIREHVTPSISQGDKRPPMQPTVETQYPTSGASTAKPPASSIGEEGRAIVQRHLNRSSKGVIQHTMVPLDLAEPARPATPAPVDKGVKPHPHSVSGESEEGGSQPVVIDAEHQTAESPAVSSAASTDHLGTTILQRSLDGLSERSHDNDTLPFYQTTYRARGEDMAEEAINSSVRSGATFLKGVPEMPLRKGINRDVERTTIEGAALSPVHSAKGYRFDMPGFPAGPAGRPPSIQTQQEAGSSASTAMPTAPPPAELPTQTATEPASEVDVMGVADQVYEILVHRLASERERRGL